MNCVCCGTDKVAIVGERAAICVVCTIAVAYFVHWDADKQRLVSRPMPKLEF